VQSFLAKNAIQVIPHPPTLLTWHLWTFLVPDAKEQLSGLTMTLMEFKIMWEGVIRTITKDNFARAFARWLERCKKCI
jgi:hypothetical protein